MTIAPGPGSSKQYDVFISYNRNDSEHASQLLRELEKRTLRAWMDRSNMAPNDRWRAEIASALGHARGVAVLIGPSGLGGWQELELLLVLATQVEHKRRIIPVPLPGAPRAPTLPDLLAPYMHCDLRASHRGQQVDALAEVLLADRTRKPERDTPDDAGPADWLVRLFQSAGKPLLRREPAPRVVRAQPEPAGSRRLFSAEDADELLQNLADNAPQQVTDVTEVTQIVPAVRERLSS